MRTIYGFMLIAFLISSSGFVETQHYSPPAYVFHPNQQIQIKDLPLRIAQSSTPQASLVASLEIIFHDPDVCCGKNSALEDAVRLAGPMSLKDISAKLQGNHKLSDGRPIMITAEYLARTSITPGQIIATLSDMQPSLIEWNSHLYVLYGVIFDETLYYTGKRDYVIRKLSLLDPRFVNARREVSFNRQTDDWTTVQGILALSALTE